MTTERNPFTATITKHKTVTSGITMITRAPYPNGQYYRIKKIDISTTDPEVLTSGLKWSFWDQDLSSTTTAAQGSGASPLYVFGVAGALGASGGVSLAVSGVNTFNVNKTSDQLPSQPFYAGVTCLTNQVSIINLELEIA